MSVPGLPWVASPGEVLKGAPPLWAFAEDGRITAVYRPHPDQRPPAPLGDAYPVGWFEAVDAEGRSR